MIFHWNSDSTLTLVENDDNRVSFMYDAERNRTGGVVAIGAVCSLCLSCFSISLLRDSLCRRIPTSSVICSFISLISTSFSLTWHLNHLNSWGLWLPVSRQNIWQGLDFARITPFGGKTIEPRNYGANFNTLSPKWNLQASLFCQNILNTFKEQLNSISMVYFC